jgi:hypothetical protein
MHRVATSLWNQIAPLAKSHTWRRRMELKGQALHDEMDRLGTKLRALGAETPVVLAYMDVAPMFQERAAIESFLKTNPQWRGPAFPELLTVNEALLLAIQEHQLTEPQTQTLRRLLETRPPI